MLVCPLVMSVLAMLCQQSADCLSYMADGGGKPSGELSHKRKTETVVASSPLKAKKEHCGHCFFKEETDKNTARKKSGYILDGIVCEGLDKERPCGKEFVQHEHEASCKEKACVPSLKNKAWWCPNCNWVLCTPCHGRYCTEMGNNKKSGRRLC
jgi:hypothetical protein